MNNGLYDVPGCSATCSAAARASWLAFPATKPSKLNSGMRLERSACGDRGATARAARTAGADVLTSSGASAVSRVSDTRIGEEKNSAPIASMRGTNRSFTHCSTKRWGRNRSEEHTSELQSRQYLVCRLLLEKKKIKPVK